jgi:integrase
MRERHQNGWVVESGKRVKKWIGHWHPYRPDGTRGNGKVVLGLEDKLRAHIAKETGKKQSAPVEESTLQGFWEHVYLPSRTWSPATRSAVTSVVVRHLLPQFGTEKLTELNKLTLQMHINALAESYSESVVKKVIVQTRAILEECVEQEIVGKNVARKLVMPSTRTSCGRFLSLEEFDAIMKELDFRDRLIVRMFCSMGFRPGELFALRWDDIEDVRMRVDESLSPWGMRKPKTKGSDAYIPMPSSVRDDMNLWRGMRQSASPASMVFPAGTGKPLSPHNYERDVIVPAAIRAGIMAKPPKARKKGDRIRDKATAVNFQAFRRTFATWMQKTTATIKDVQGAMRHSTPDQTIRVYMREIPAGVRDAVDSLDRMFNEKRALSDAKPEGGVQ